MGSPEGVTVPGDAPPSEDPSTPVGRTSAAHDGPPVAGSVRRGSVPPAVRDEGARGPEVTVDPKTTVDHGSLEETSVKE